MTQTLKATKFIAKQLRFHGRIAMATTAVASFIIIIAVAISSGFRKELRDGIASISGDIQLTAPDLNIVNENSPIRRHPGFLPVLDTLEGIRSIRPAIYRAGIIKNGENIHGVLFKGVEDGTVDSLNVSIPKRLAELLSLHEGDKMLTYFVGEKVKARQFRIKDIYPDLLGNDNALIVYAGLSDMQRLNGWGPEDVSALEIIVDDELRNKTAMKEISEEVGARVLLYTPEDEDTVVASSALNKYPEIFSWLDLIDFNVLFILILMTVVAGFNMISSLLIMLFRNISTIGILKSMGMTDRSIAGVFLRVSSSVVLKGMLIGNAVAFLFCAVQSSTHLIRLNPENYFLDFVPVHVNVFQVIAADVVSYALIMILLTLPCLFISSVDPAKTVRAQ